MGEITQEKSNKTRKIADTVLFSAAILLIGSAVQFFINEVVLEQSWNRVYLGMSLVLLLVLLFYGVAEWDRVFAARGSLVFALLFFLISALLLVLPDVYMNFPVWLIGGILAAALLDRNLGMLYVYFFVLQAMYLQSGSIRGLVLHFVAATVICILVPRMKTWLSMLYVMAISSAAIVCLSVLMNRIRLKEDMLLDTMMILLVYLLCIFCAMLLRTFFLPSLCDREQTEEPTVGEDLEKKYDYLVKMAEETAEETAVSEQCLDHGERKAEEPARMAAEYLAYCEERAALLLSLKQKSGQAYTHSVLVGRLSAEAAGKIGASEPFAKAIGLYHEIGKLREGAAWEQTILLAKEHAFPEQLQKALQECCLPEEHPLSHRESAVVALTDAILTTYFFLRGRQNVTSTAGKIVDNAIGMKLTQGKLNDSGLSVTDCSVIRNYFVEQLELQDKKRGIA